MAVGSRDNQVHANVSENVPNPYTSNGIYYLIHKEIPFEGFFLHGLPTARPVTRSHAN